MKRWYNTVRANGTLYKRDMYGKVQDVVSIDYPNARRGELDIDIYQVGNYRENGRQVAIIWITEEP